LHGLPIILINSMLKRIKKRGFVAVLIFLGLFLAFNALAIGFVNDVKLDLTGLTSDVYINGDPTGSQASSLTVSGANLTVSGIPSGNPFTLENASNAILLRLTPPSGIANFSLSSANVSGGYIIQWNTISAVLVNYLVGVPLANTNYQVSISVGGFPVPGSPFLFNSGPSAQLSFGYTGAGVFTVSVVAVIVPPTMTTSAAASILTTSATLNGNITNTGGANALERGFEWGTVSGVYPNSGTELGSYGTGAFTRGITGLTVSTTYYFRSKARNSAGWAYGAQLSFTTAVDITCQNHEIWGWAYSENIGWISFGCQNTMAIGTGINYGVDIDELNSRLFGYAWAENIGWISFNNTDLVGCPSGTCQASINMSTGTLSGWARALSPVGRPLSETGGWDGWIKLSGSNYGVTLNSTPDPSEFQNWAWGGDPNDDNNEAVIGLISFNGNNVVGGAAYAVYTNLSVNNAPTAAINPITTGNYCFTASPPIFLNWTFSDVDAGDTQSAYQIQIDNSGAGFPSPEVDTGKVINSGNTYAPIGLSFGTTYWWRIRVWDSRDLQSAGWATSLFATDSRWPEPSFVYNPAAPLVEEDVQFDSTVNFCVACTYLWNFDTGSSDIIADPVYAFPAEDNYNVTLRATSGGLWCEVSQIVSIGAALPLPTWNEIAPF
ncbi:MAG: hypothetical protein Q8N58_02965, partial [bacterium]|nr:hypothetical protein [bacterium]